MDENCSIWGSQRARVFWILDALFGHLWGFYYIKTWLEIGARSCQAVISQQNGYLIPDEPYFPTQEDIKLCPKRLFFCSKPKYSFSVLKDTSARFMSRLTSSFIIFFSSFPVFPFQNMGMSSGDDCSKTAIAIAYQRGKVHVHTHIPSVSRFPPRFSVRNEVFQSIKWHWASDLRINCAVL